MGTLIADNLTKQYGISPNTVSAINDVSLTISEGFTAITGPSGSGKSTLLHLLGGLERPTTGLIKVNNTNLSIFDDEGMAIFRRRNIGFIFRDYNLIPILNIYENMILPLELDDRDADTDYLRQISKLLKIEDKLSYFPQSLSTGERQKAAIARALSTKPAVVLADEPTGNLDSHTSREVVGLLKMTCKEFSQAIVMVTLDKEIAELADRVIHLKDGTVQKIEERRKMYVHRE